MNTIIYLKMEKKQRQRMQEALTFHIKRVNWDAIEQDPEAMLILEGMQLLFVTIPWEIEKKYSCWPKELVGWLNPFWGYSASIETVYELSVEKWIWQKGMSEKWSTFWPYPLYKEYHLPEYAKILVKKGMEIPGMSQVYCYVLGYEAFVPQILAPYLKRIKKLEFIVAADCPLQPETYLENLAWEEGIAANCRLLKDRGEYRKIRLECQEPAIVIDFTGEENVRPANAAQSLIWIDMDALDNKKNKILANSRETIYFSVKEEWGRLDTVTKNGYNTIVN